MSTKMEGEGQEDQLIPDAPAVVPVGVARGPLYPALAQPQPVAGVQPPAYNPAVEGALAPVPVAVGYPLQVQAPAPQLVIIAPGRNVQGHVVARNPWKHDLFDCCAHDAANCLFGFLCGHFASCCAADIVTDGRRTTTIVARGLGLAGISGCAFWCCASCCGVCAVCCVPLCFVQNFLDRHDVIRARNIESDGLTEFVSICCCTSCATMQAYNEALTYKQEQAAFGLIRQGQDQVQFQ